VLWIVLPGAAISTSSLVCQAVAVYVGVPDVIVVVIDVDVVVATVPSAVVSPAP
jgi:hypothetical protein